MIAIFSDSVLGNTVNDTATSVPQNTLYLADYDRILAILFMVVDEFFCPWLCPWLYSRPLKYSKIIFELL